MVIHELATRTGLSVHTIRYYEKEGLLDEQHAKRSSNNYRHYSEDTLERLGMIRQGKAAGFTLTEIRNLMTAWEDGTMTEEEKIAIVRSKLQSLREKQEEIAAMRRILEEKLELLLRS